MVAVHQLPQHERHARQCQLRGQVGLDVDDAARPVRAHGVENRGQVEAQEIVSDSGLTDRVICATTYSVIVTLDVLSATRPFCISRTMPSESRSGENMSGSHLMLDWLSPSDVDTTLVLSVVGSGPKRPRTEATVIKVRASVLQQHIGALRPGKGFAEERGVVRLEFANAEMVAAFEDLVVFCYREQVPETGYRLYQLMLMADRFSADGCMTLCGDKLKDAALDIEISRRILEQRHKRTPFAVALRPACPAAGYFITETLRETTPLDTALLFDLFGDVTETLNDTGLKQMFTVLPISHLLAWIQYPRLRTDTEDSILCLILAAARINDWSPADVQPVLDHVRMCQLECLSLLDADNLSKIKWLSSLTPAKIMALQTMPKKHRRRSLNFPSAWWNKTRRVSCRIYMLTDSGGVTEQSNNDM